MAKVIFFYEGIETCIQCDINEKIKNIINKFLIKIKKDYTYLFFIYNGEKIDEDLTVYEQANQ